MVERTRARRAQKSLWPTRLAALAVPAALVGLLSSGVAIAAWPNHDDALARPAVSAASASASSGPVAARDDSTERTTRLLANGRPALSAADSAAAAAKAKAKAAAKKDEAEKKAARAEKKKKAAAEKKAEKKEAAKKKAAAEKKAAAAKKRAQVFRPTAAQREVTGRRYSRVSLNVRTQPKSSSDLVTVVKRGTRLSITDTTKGAWTLVIYRDKPRWVHTEYLVKDKPKKVKAKSSSSSSSGGGISSKACSSGSGMESGLTQDAVRVHRAVCAQFPSVKSYGGMRSGGDSFHTSGRAVDIMVSGSRGQAIADWVRSHRKALGVSEIIWSQQIWTVQRGGEGWRSMSDRGNATANHYDHVHVSVYGNRGTS